MFDPATAQLLQSAPSVPGLDPRNLPELLTLHYATLVSARLRDAEGEAFTIVDEWPPERIANTYEAITSLQTDGPSRRAAAFVSGTARQLLARRLLLDSTPSPDIDRDGINPALSAALLFLIAEQYADANETASLIKVQEEGQLYEATLLAKDIVDLACGRLQNVLARAEEWQPPARELTLEEQSLAALLETLIIGIEMLCERFLNTQSRRHGANSFDSPQSAFLRVLTLSAVVDDVDREALGHSLLNAYAGPNHLASLLLAAYDGLHDAALINLPPPSGADPGFWDRWLNFRAKQFPFIWPNHREAIKKEFHQTGKSAVIVLPTGAGKTSVSSIKIAGVLARGEKVIFLVPTHALVDQLTVDLKETFPEHLLGSVVSSDFDLLLQSGAQLKEIEVMTPERCLAMLSFAPEAFADVGLLVFDECHLLSPQFGKIRRSLDGMLCLLRFNSIAPLSDLLFLSAMLRDADVFSEWIEDLTGRSCVCVDVLWKPSRQARGVLIYREEDLNNAKHAAEAYQAQENRRIGKVAKGLRIGASRLLTITPWAIWGLKHNWLEQNKAACSLLPILDRPITLSGDIKYGPIYLKPNANHVAARLAISAAQNGLKVIVFVNTKNDAISVAHDISANLNEKIDPTEDEQLRWEALEAELGDLRHTFLQGPSVAVPHNSLMLRIERDLSERLFSRENGAKVIVATPTLAQGLNLPAHLAILAGDKRASGGQSPRENLEAHEILNAAARAGRAGHLANGVVLLVPEPIISFSSGKPLEGGVIEKLKSVLPEDDRCVVISDPLDIVLDRLMSDNLFDVDVQYMVNRMAALREAEGLDTPTLLFDIRKSFAAFSAQKRKETKEFESKILALKQAIQKFAPAINDSSIAVLAMRSGLSMDLLFHLRERIERNVGSLPVNIEGWLRWTIQWLMEDDYARTSLLFDVNESVKRACGLKQNQEIEPADLQILLSGLLAWISGQNLASIEKSLGGNPDSESTLEQFCPRSRDLVANVIPRGLSFTMGLISHVVREIDAYSAQVDLTTEVVDILGTAIRRGFDSPEKVYFASSHPNILSRVQAHQTWSLQSVL